MGWDWTLIALCVPDSQKQDYFCNYSQAVGSKGFYDLFLDYQDSAKVPRNSISEMKKSVLGIAGNKKFDYVFTHSRDPNCEYGIHANHVEVLKVTSELVREGLLGCSLPRLAYFKYRAIYSLGGLATVADRDAICFLQLNYTELIKKAELTSQAPDASDSLKNLAYPCPNPEAFEGDKLDLPDSIFRMRQ